MKSNNNYSLLKLVLSTLPLMSQAQVNGTTDFLKVSSQNLTKLLADRMACPQTKNSSNSLQEGTFQDYTLNSLRNDFLKTCEIVTSPSLDLVDPTSFQVNNERVESQANQIENTFLNRFTKRSGLNPSSEILTYANILSKSILDIRIQARRMHHRGWQCSADDSTMLLIHSRLNKPTDSLKLSRANETLPSNNSCDSFLSSAIDPWNEGEYLEDGTLTSLPKLEDSEQAVVTNPTDPLQGSLKPAPSNFLFAKSNGVVMNTSVRNRATTEAMVYWDECGGVEGSIKGNYFEDKRDVTSTAAWPSSNKISSCAKKRLISKAFATFMSNNLGRCIAMGIHPEAQKMIYSTLIQTVRKTDTGAVDRSITASAKSANNSYSAQIDQLANDILSIEVLHQGVIGDDAHSQYSNHNRSVLRAIDISNIRLKLRNGTSLVFEHGVASYVENFHMRSNVYALNEAQMNQYKFWITLNACLTEKGAGIIS